MSMPNYDWLPRSNPSRPIVLALVLVLPMLALALGAN